MKAQVIDPKSVARDTLTSADVYRFTGRILDTNNQVLALIGGQEFWNVVSQVQDESKGLMADFEVGRLQLIDNHQRELVLDQQAT